MSVHSIHEFKSEGIEIPVYTETSAFVNAVALMTSKTDITLLASDLVMYMSEEICKTLFCNIHFIGLMKIAFSISTKKRVL